jgi:hypothetical protein
MLQAQSGAALLGRGGIAAFGLAATGILHRMAFVEDNDPVEVGTGQWFPYHASATLEEALRMIETDPILQPHT